MSLALERPVKLTLGVTEACPLKCRYCYSDCSHAPKRGELSFDEWAPLVDSSIEDGVIQVYIEGGEPLAKPGIAPVGKRLIADLAECLPRMADDVYRKHPQDAPPLKLEGIALLDARHVVIVNDNDFGVHGSSPGKDPSQTGTADDARPATPRTCLWVVELPTALWPEAAGRAIATP